jgi:quaternary ammonium compound-resistance protein SugE
MNRAWIMLLAAGVLEVIWAATLKSTDGFDFRAKPGACVLTLVTMGLSMYLLAVAVQTIPIGTGYAVWTGIGALGTAIAGMVWYREPATVVRLVCLLLVVGGMVGLKLTSGKAE